mmetsp:Transcript_8289/g.24892  ORF Transcript_8289/g.24892 Transcript_8289/m.24892 type:complete len:80 (+) Transcript_8289:55-294(+)
MDLEGYEEFKSPINSSAFVYLAAVFLFVGLSATGWLFATLAISNKYNRNWRQEGLAAVVASFCLALGTVFVLVANGVWV